MAYVFIHHPTKERITLDDPKGLADAAAAAREKAKKEKKTPPAWCMSPGECTMNHEPNGTGDDDKPAPEAAAPKAAAK